MHRLARRGTAAWSAAFRLTALTFAAASVHAQSLEPRSYSNSPVGLNFLIAGYAYSDGKLPFDPALPVADAQFHTNNGILGYVRTLDVLGKSAKVDVIVPYSAFSAHALVAGQLRHRDVSGFADPLFRLSVNFYGAPALSPKDFASYRQDLIIGASLQVSTPLGQYDDTKLLNLGNNRWSFKSELGISKAWGPWILEFAPGATFYTDDTDFNRGQTFSQAPFYSMQAHVVYSFQSGVWLAVDGTWFSGGRVSVNGVTQNNLQTNTRAGVTLALPVDRHNSAKLYGSTGTSSRTGSGFSAIGVAWQYRWGGGF